MPQKKMKNRHRIGLFIDWSENPYHVSLISGVQDKAKEKKINLFIFIGGCINSPRKWEKPRNIIYHLVKKTSLDGLIVSSGSVGHYSTTLQMTEFIGKYSFLPVLSISQVFSNIPSIMVDNTSGLKKMIMHLIKDHQYKRIAMITGPPGNQEAEQRYQIYRETLKEYGIAFNKNLIVHGDFMYQSGIKGMKRLIKRKTAIDAVFAANDSMALGAINAIKETGNPIPGNIAVVGFDDINLSRYSNPPLTTVRQPIYEQGIKAIELILSLISGKTVPRETDMPTELIIRESCGCNVKFMSTVPSIQINKNNRSKTGNSSINPETLTKDIINKIKSYSSVFLCKINSSNIRRLLDSFIASLKSKDTGDFLNSLAFILDKVEMRDEDEIFWQNIITIIRQAYIPYITDPGDIKTAETLWHAARITVNIFFQRNYGYLKAVTEEESKAFRDISEELISIINMDDILKLLSRELHNLKIESCFISLYEKQNSDAFLFPVSSRMIFAYKNGKNISHEFKDILYATDDILPKGILSADESHSFFLEPIFFGTYQLGFALLEYGEKKSPVYNIMRRMFFNGALKAAIYVLEVQIHSLNLEAQVSARTEALSKANRLLAKLYQERKNAEDQVRKLNEDLEKRVIERTTQLENANKKLKRTLDTLQSTQAKLVQSEKMAALGGLVAGIAHEINTPIGIGVTAASHMDSLAKELLEKFGNNTLKKSDINKFINTTNTASKMVLTNLRRAYELIRSFKKIAVDQSSEIRRKFNIKEYLDEILLSLQPQLKKTTHIITVKCPENIIMNSYPGPFSQIVTNLVMNSVIHGYQNNESGNIFFDITTKNNSIIFVYSDDGKGIKTSHMKKIFDPFFTTNRSKGGTGLGLHLLYNIVTRTFGGTVKCKSKSGEGTTFTIIFPHYK